MYLEAVVMKLEAFASVPGKTALLHFCATIFSYHLIVAGMLAFFKWFIVVLVILLLAGMFYEWFSRRKLERKTFSGKTFVQINGKKLHYVKKGNGNCTVVFQSGMGSSHAIWQPIQDSISAHAVTIAYDRSGIMLSDDTGMAPTNQQVTQELELLLEKTGCPKPYTLVGHSMAGIYLRPFIKRNANDIAGIVFVEAAHPQQLNLSSPQLIKALQPPPRWFIHTAVKTGIYRILFSMVPLSPEIPMDHPLHEIEKNFFYRTCNKVLQEVDNDRLNFKDAERYNFFGDIPLTVVIGTSPIRYASLKDDSLKDEYKKVVETVQPKLLSLSSNSRLVRAENSGHIVQVDDAKLLIDVINTHLASAFK